MAIIGRGQTSDVSAPILDVYLSIGDTLLDPVALDFKIEDISTDAARETPVQVYPVAGYQAVDLVADRVSLGRFVAEWSVPNDNPVGTHRISWRATLVAGEDPAEWSEDFEVVQLASIADAGPRGYTTVARMRAEGLPVGRADDDRVADLIAEMSWQIDTVCGWWFEPRDRVLSLDGLGVRSLWLPAPIIRLDEVTVGGVRIDTSTGAVVYGGCPTGPQKPLPRLDRAPRGGCWPRGQRNITIRGVFGYTEDNGTAYGRTPFAIRRACEMMVLRGARPLDSDADERWRGRIVEQKTNRQMIKFSAVDPASAVVAWDDDPEISRLLGRYRRPPAIRATGRPDPEQDTYVDPRIV